MKYIVTVLLLCTCLFAKGQVKDFRELVSLLKITNELQLINYLENHNFVYEKKMFDKNLNMTLSYYHLFPNEAKKTSKGIFGYGYRRNGDVVIMYNDLSSRMVSSFLKQVDGQGFKKKYYNKKGNISVYRYDDKHNTVMVRIKEDFSLPGGYFTTFTVGSSDIFKPLEQ